ncbi:MAG: AsmA-like C-terminal region-containing protein, partial [Bacteroidales bacterium]
VVKLIKKEVSNYIIPDVYTDIDFTLIRTFPYASVVFKNTRIEDTLQQDSFLLQAERIYFKFNVISLLRDDYKLTNLELSNGKLNLLMDEHGNTNYEIIRSSADTTKQQLRFEMEKILLRNIETCWTDQKSSNYAHFTLRKALAKGKFTAKNFDLSTAGDINIHEFRVNDMAWIKEAHVEADLEMMVSQEQEQIRMQKGLLTFNAIPLDITGSMGYGMHKHVNLNLKSPRFELNTLLKELPKQYSEIQNTYSFQGDSYIAISLSGTYGPNRLPHVKSSFSIDRGEVAHKKSGVKVENLSLNGNFTNGESNAASTSSLKIEDIKGLFAGEKFNAAFRLRNLEDPDIRIKTKARCNIERLNAFINMDTLEVANGILDMDLLLSFRPGDINSIKPADFRQSKTEGSVLLSDVNMKLRGSPVMIHDMSGGLSFNTRDVVIRELRGKLNQKSDFRLKGYLENLLPFLLFEDQNLHIIADFSSSHLLLDELVQSKKQSSDTAVEEYYVNFPEYISFDMDLDVKRLNFRKFQGEAISGTASLNKQILKLSNIRMNSMGGRISARGNIRAKTKENILVKGDVYMKNVDIRKAFVQLENLKQENITAQNLSGQLTSNFTLSASFRKNLKIIRKSLTSQAGITIKNGKLINFTPLERMSKFLRVDDLSSVEFETLENTISIKEEEITIPKMDINSSALDIKVSGKHTFNQEITYYIELLLSELLSREARDNKPENTEFGEIQDDGLGRTKIFLKVHGTMDNPRFSYDTEGLRKELRKDMQEEKQELKQIMHDELGLFRSDSTVEQKPKSERQIAREEKRKAKEREKERLKEREKGKFIIEWEDE